MTLLRPFSELYQSCTYLTITFSVLNENWYNYYVKPCTTLVDTKIRLFQILLNFFFQIFHKSTPGKKEHIECVGSSLAEQNCLKKKKKKEYFIAERNPKRDFLKTSYTGNYYPVDAFFSRKSGFFLFFYSMEWFCFFFEASDFLMIVR